MHDGNLTSFKHQSDYITTIWQITIKLIQSLTSKYMWLGPLTNYSRQSRQLNCVAASQDTLIYVVIYGKCNLQD